MGQHTKIICYKKIVIGHQSLISWDCTLMDSDAHPFYDLEQQRLISNSESIAIGCRTFIGQRSTILKGAFLPNYSSLASNSLLNKKMMDQFALYGGIPARLVKKNIARIINERDIQEGIKILQQNYNNK